MSAGLTLNQFLVAGTTVSRSGTNNGKRKTFKVNDSAFASVAAPRISLKKQENLYKVLQVEETASATEIKTAYRNLAKQFHPDTISSSSNGEEFMAIHEAYATLSDTIARARYDISMAATRRFRFSGQVASPTRRWETDQCW